MPRTRGSARHVESADAAVNAIEKTTPVIGALRQLEAEYNAEANHPYFREFQQPVHLNVGPIGSGDWPSTVPSDCVMECRLACLPGVTVDQTQAQVREAVAASARSDPWLRENPPAVEFCGFRAEPSFTDPRSTSMQILAKCHEGVVGAPLIFKSSTATTHKRFFLNDLGIPATSYGPAGENIHAGDERVSITRIRQTACVLALYLLHWCGLAG